MSFVWQKQQNVFLIQSYYIGGENVVLAMVFVVLVIRLQDRPEAEMTLYLAFVPRYACLMHLICV